MPERPDAGLLDGCGRSISYLRVSVTDRCNLRCRYCMPEQGVDFRPHDEILQYEEIESIVRVGATMGLRRVRLTGGEPLVRRGLAGLVRALASIPQIDDLSLTTNGVALAPLARELADAGLRRVNVSLDTLKPERFKDITRWGELADVFAGIAAAREAGLSPVKLNAVLIRGFNDDELIDFARSTLTEDWEVRFIELMPFMEDCPMDVSIASGPLTAGDVRRRIESELGALEPATTEAGQGPAECWRIPGAAGKIGFIGPLSEPRFCESCNRMRLTADGRLRPCLLTDREVDLRSILRSGGGDDGIRQGILDALAAKPDAHHLNDGNLPRKRRMAQIGG